MHEYNTTFYDLTLYRGDNFAYVCTIILRNRKAKRPETRVVFYMVIFLHEFTQPHDYTLQLEN